MAQKTIFGSSGNDSLVGSLGDDVIIAGAGNDVLNGGNGNDTYIVTGLNDGFDSFKDSGTSGYDLIKAGAVGTRIGLKGFDPTSGIEEISAGGLAGVFIGGTDGNDILNFSKTKLTGIQRIEGGYGNDTIVGSTGNDVIAGGSGSDVLNGGEGSDTYVFSGINDGIDTIKDTGVTGYDKIVAGAAGTLIGLNGFGPTSGIEEISAAGFQNVVVTGTTGNDILDFAKTRMTGIQRIEGGYGNDTITGSAGNDVIAGGSGSDVLNGGEGSDTYVFSGINDGIDTIKDAGVIGYDKIVAGAAGTLIGLNGFGPASGIEEISAAGFQNVVVTGTTGNDILDFTKTKLTGIQRIEGGYGNDTITGSAGDDVISGGPGANLLNGGQGSDTYFVTGATGGFDLIKDSGTTGYDRVVAGSDGTVIGLTQFGPASGVEEVSAAGFKNVGIRATDNSDVLDFSATKLTGIAQINGGYGNDTIIGSTGDDVIGGGAGGDILQGGGGNDTAVYSGNRAAYQVTATSTGFTVKALSGSDGVDSLTGFERIRFADGLFDLKTGVGVVLPDTSASSPTLAVAAASGQEDSAIALNIKAALTDLDGSESLAVTISGVPNGAVLSAGVNKGQGVWQLTGAQLQGLTITPPADSGDNFSLTVKATSTEASNGATSSVSGTLTVAVAAVADMPTLAAPISLTGTGNQAVALGLSALLTDLDGSESLSMTLSGLPLGASLSSGTKNSDGSWSLTAAQLSNLTMTAPDGSGSFTLQLRATATETEGSSATAVRTIAVSIADSAVAGPAATIKGTLNADALIGTIGNDVIDGGAGADKMTGGKGDDVYYVDNASDQVIENYGEGTDTVYSSINYALPAGWNVENVVLRGKSNLKAVGNNANNVLTGNSGDNVLDGGAGSDMMIGGAGNDTYYVSDSADKVAEKANEGIDTVIAKFGYTAGDNIENIVLDASYGAHLTGNALNNALTGNSGGDALSGGAGNDSLEGGAGDDKLDGGDGDDTAVYDGNMADYKITKLAEGFSVTDLKTGEGTDYLTQIENLKFADQTIKLDPLNPAYAPTPAPSSSSGPTPTPTTTTPNVVLKPVVAEAVNPGDIVGLQLQNTGTGTESSGYVTFGQVFKTGDVMPGTNMVAHIGGQDVPVQMDVKATNPDGSVRHAILTLKAPEISAGGSIDVMLGKATAAAAQPALQPGSALTNGLDLKVDIGLHNADGSITPIHLDAAAVLKAAIANGTVETWMSGPQASEFRVETEVTTGLRATFDIRVYADGKIHTDVVMSNDSTFTPNIKSFTYDVAIKEAGATVYSQTALNHHQNSTWHQEVWQGDATDLNVVRDVDYLVETGAVPAYDTSVGVNSSAIDADLSQLATENTGPMGTGTVTTWMASTGARPDIGVETAWGARYVLSQDADALKMLLANADASGSVPWHFRDEATGEWVRVDDHPKFWIAEGRTGVATQDALPEAWTENGSGWSVDNSHRPSLTYLPYMFTGSHYYLDELTAQVSNTMAVMGPGYVRDANGLIIPNHEQVRGLAWALRDLGDAAYLTPDGSALKGYFDTLLKTNLANFVKMFVTDGIMDQAGELEGYLFANYGSETSGRVAPWQQDFVAITMNYLDQRGYSDAGTMLEWMDNFISGRYTHGEEGFNPLNGAAYSLNVADSGNVNWNTTWAEAFNDTTNWTWNNAAVTSLGNDASSASGQAAMGKAAVAGIISATGSGLAVEAYGYICSQTTNMNTASDPAWSITPKLADGTYLQATNIHITTTTGDAVMTGSSANELLHGNAGNDQISGGAGIDMLFGGTGNDILDGGTGNDYLYGGAGNDTLTGGSGNDYLKGGSGADTFSYVQANGGHDVIADFQAGADVLKIAKDLNGDGQMTAADVLNHATTDTDGNVVLHLGNDDVTLLGVTQQQLANGSILIV